MKNKQILILFLIGTVLVIAGATMKILKYELSSLPLILGLTFEGAAMVFLIMKMLKKDKTDDNGFLDS